MSGKRDVKKSCCKCHARHFKNTEKCQCGCEFFEGDIIVVSRYYFTNATGADVGRAIRGAGYAISNKAILDAMQYLGYPNVKVQHESRQNEIRDYLKNFDSPPTAQHVIDKFGMNSKTARRLLDEVFKRTPKPKRRVDNGEKQILKGYMAEYEKFRQKPKSQQFPLEPDMVLIINTLQRHKMI